jgi:serine/threonine protein kinase
VPLSAVHSAGLLHCDIKPANIMLRENGQCVLIDFGLARPLSELSRGLDDEPLQGSPFYMSPEQAQGLPLDARSGTLQSGHSLPRDAHRTPPLWRHQRTAGAAAPHRRSPAEAAGSLASINRCSMDCWPSSRSSAMPALMSCCAFLAVAA